MKTLSLLLLGLWPLAHAAPPVVSNVRASQMPGTKFVNIYYNLADPDGDLQTIEVRVSSDGGLTYSRRANSFMGDVVFGVATGTGKHVLWDAGTDFGGNFIERCKVRITATDWDSVLRPCGDDGDSRRVFPDRGLAGGSGFSYRQYPDQPILHRPHGGFQRQMG